MFSYATIDQLPEELYQDVSIPDFYGDTELDFPKDIKAEKKLRLDGHTITVQMDLSKVMEELWDYVREYADAGSFYDPAEVADVVWYDPDSTSDLDEELDEIPDEVEPLSEDNWRTRLRIFMAACKRAALPEVMNYIAKAAPKDDDGLLELGTEICIATLALVDENRECRLLKAWVSGPRRISILLETETMTCTTMLRADDDVSVNTDFFRNIPRRRPAAKSEAAQSLPQSDDETALCNRLPVLTYTQGETFQLYDELRITVPDGYRYARVGFGVNEGWCCIVPENTSLYDNHIDARPYSFALTAKPIGDFKFHAAALNELSNLLLTEGYLKQGITVDAVVRSAHCAFVYQNFYNSGDPTWNKIAGFVLTDQHIYQMHIYANHSAPIAANQSVIDQFLQVGREWMQHVSLIGNESWVIQYVGGQNPAQTAVSTPPRAAAQPQIPKPAQTAVSAPPRAAEPPKPRKPAPVIVSESIPGVHVNDVLVMFAILSNEMALIQLKRPKEEFCEIYSDQFPNLSNETIIQLRDKVSKALTNNVTSSYEEFLMSKSCEYRFKLTTLNLYNVTDKDMEEAAPWAIQKTRKWFREDERELVETLMEIEQSKTRRMLDNKLERLDDRLTEFFTSKHLLRIVLSDRQEDGSEAIQNASHFQLDVDSCALNVEIAAPNPNCGDIALHNYFPWYWGVTIRDIWETAAANGFQDRRRNPSNGKAYVEQALNQIRKRYPKVQVTHPNTSDTPASGSSKPAKREGCYIATAVYGSYDAPEVLTLRRFRDETLRRTALGRWFIRTYYRLSPPVAARLRHAKHVNAVVRSVLDRLVAKLEGR